MNYFFFNRKHLIIRRNRWIRTIRLFSFFCVSTADSTSSVPATATVTCSQHLPDVTSAPLPTSLRLTVALWCQLYIVLRLIWQATQALLVDLQLRLSWSLLLLLLSLPFTHTEKHAQYHRRWCRGNPGVRTPTKILLRGLLWLGPPHTFHWNKFKVSKIDTRFVSL